jgi:hypothetical protein
MSSAIPFVFPECEKYAIRIFPSPEVEVSSLLDDALSSEVSACCSSLPVSFSATDA